MRTGGVFLALFGMSFWCAACDTSAMDEEPSDPADTGDGEDSATEGTTVTFTTYTDESCTELPPKDSVVHLDTNTSCNATPDSSISELVCYADRITYTNHPNTEDCSANGIPNELFVGVCQEFPGPARTWKLIEADSYDCLSPEG
jgi:hypothetical protein